MHKDDGLAFYCGLNAALFLVIAASLWLAWPIF